MIPYYCSKGHENPPGSRFCLHCGEKLNLPLGKGMYPGLLLGDRYRLVRQLGQGGFGRTYLVEDTNRFDELCVLKEFAPQVQSEYVLQKAAELFEREAGVLYKLQHPQIPRFRELFRVNINGKENLFLVQDYVEGQTYHALLDARKRQGLRFSEVEVTHLLFQILPVLEYIHSLGVIHRDISPDNLILRSSDSLPVLIDFGGVKQLAATIASQFASNDTDFSPGTLLGKAGYAPQEQMQTGMVYPHSDLYAVAATMLVLLTSKEPQELIDDYTLAWNWRREVNLNPTLEAFLDKMLSQKISDRYQDASQVLQALTDNLLPSTSITTQLPNPIYPSTLEAQESKVKVVAHVTRTPTELTTVAPKHLKKWSFTPGKVLLVFLLLSGAAGVGRWAASSWLAYQDFPSQVNPIVVPPIILPVPSPKITQQPSPGAQFSAEERNRKEQLRARRQQLGISYKFYTDLVNQVFWEKYPNRKLSNNPEDAALRTEWDALAKQLLDQLEPLNPQSRRRLGTYTAQDRDHWKQQVSKRHVSTRALYDLADAEFFQMFPQQRGKNFINKPIRQVWYALAEKQLKPLATLFNFRSLVFEAGNNSQQVRGTLKPGQGRVYVVRLTKQQITRLNLQANPQVLLSIYSPSGKTTMLQDSRVRTWSKVLPESGFYEFVVVSTASEPVNFQINMTVDNLTPARSTQSFPDTTTPSSSPTQATSYYQPYKKHGFFQRFNGLFYRNFNRQL